jgi:hypothetical protein
MAFLLIHSLPPVRHAFYETFLHLHQLAASLALPGVYSHLVTHENEAQGSGWRQIFTNGPQQNFRRIALGAGANFMQHFVAYYLPVVLKRSFGFSDRMSLILSAVDSMQWMFWAGMASLVIDNVGRRRLLIFGSAGQSLCFVMAAIGLAIDTRPMNGVAVAFIFLFYFFFVRTRPEISIQC